VCVCVCACVCVCVAWVACVRLLYELHSPDTRQSDGKSALGLLLRNADYLPVEAQLECAQLLIERGCSLGSSFVALLVNVLHWPFFISRGDASGHTAKEVEQRLQLLRMLARHKDWKLGELTIEQNGPRGGPQPSAHHPLPGPNARAALG